jgi:hypothetical protein
MTFIPHMILIWYVIRKHSIYQGVKRNFTQQIDFLDESF